MINKTIQRKRRHHRIRKNIIGKIIHPRLAVFRSNKYIYAQLIDDEKSITVTSITDKKIKDKKTKVEKAFEVGEQLSKEAVKKGISKVVFDRAGYKFHGRVKALAEGARKGGLKF